MAKISQELEHRIDSLLEGDAQDELERVGVCLEAAPPVANHQDFWRSFSSSKDTIIVIDDDPLIRGLFSEALTEKWNVLTACNGQQGVETLAQRLTDVLAVLLDFQMPGGWDGEATYHQIKKTAPWLPVLMVSGSDDAAVFTRLRELGISGIIQKPCSIGTLLTSVKRVLEGGMPAH